MRREAAAPKPEVEKAAEAAAKSRGSLERPR